MPQINSKSTKYTEKNSPSKLKIDENDSSIRNRYTDFSIHSPN